MSTTFRSTCMVILLFASTSWDGCFGKIFLCSDRGGFSHNGTSVIAEIGQPASVSFCVDTDNQVHPYFTIRHPSASRDWFSNSTKDRITTRFVKDGTKATITITINPVQQNDFLDGFYVKVYREHTSNRESLLLFFQFKTGSQIWPCSSHDAVSSTVDAQLGQPASFTFCAETNGTFQSNITIHHRRLSKIWYEDKQMENDSVYVNILHSPSQMNINITIREVTKQCLDSSFNVTMYNTDGKKMTVRFQLKLKGEGNTENGETKQESVSEGVGDGRTSTHPRCLPDVNSGCPEGWYPVADNRCIRLFSPIRGVYPSKQCPALGGRLPEISEITELKSCLQYLFENTTVKRIRTNGNTYNVLTGMKVNGKSDYMVTCLVNKNKLGTTSQSTTSRTPGGLTHSTSTTVKTQLTSLTKGGEAVTESSTTQTTLTSRYTSTASHTPGGHRCLPRTSSVCPENMHPVDDHRCLSLVPHDANYNSAQTCKKLGGQLAETRDITELMPCLEYFLENTTATWVRFSSSPDIRLNATKPGRTSNGMIACLIDTRPLVAPNISAPNISEFYVETVDVSKKRKINLLIGLSAAKLDLTDKTLLTVVCRATGKPSPELTLSRDNITLQDFNGSSLLIREPDCSNSGVYTCHASNSHSFAKVQARIELQSPIKMNPITFNNRRAGNISILSGNDVAVNCSMTGCPNPDALTLADDANLTLSAYRKSYVVHEITRVQCSDMGTYHCRAEAEGLEDRRDLLVEQCPLQLCRGQEKSVTIPMKLNQTTSVSVCLMSDEMPTWENVHGSKNISVVFTQRNVSRIYFSAEISVSKTGDGHIDGFTIVMRNRHGSLDYLVQIQPVVQGENEGHTDPSASNQSSVLPVVLPLAAIVVIVVAVVALVMYRHKAKGGDRRTSSVRKVLNSSYSGNDESGQAMYANFSEIVTGNSSQDTQTTLAEDAIVENCGDNERSSYITDEDSGRFISDEGLVYLTLVQLTKKLQRTPTELSQKPKLAANDIDDHVEYLTLDFEKTGKFQIPDETDSEKPENETGQEKTS